MTKVSGRFVPDMCLSADCAGQFYPVLALRSSSAESAPLACDALSATLAACLARASPAVLGTEPQSMSKQAPAPAPAPAQAPPPAYGKAAMVDLVDEIDWSACEVLNATGSLQNVLKQGLRDQEGLLLESDADEQATYGL